METTGSFEIPDLRWIAASIGYQIRLTVDGDTYDKIVETHAWLPRDCLFGKISGGPPAHTPHLLFSWKNAAEELRKFGHFDLLHPSKGFQTATYYLQPTAPCMNLEPILLQICAYVKICSIFASQSR